jgi:hypothetical protein
MELASHMMIYEGRYMEELQQTASLEAMVPLPMSLWRETEHDHRILDGLGLPLSPLKSVAAHLVDPKHASDDCLFPAFPNRNHVLHMF